MANDQQQLTVMEALQHLQSQGKLAYRTLSDDWIITFGRGGRTHFIEGYFHFDLNSQAASSIATDKVDTYLLLLDAGLAAVPHALITNVMDPKPDEEILQTLLHQHGPLVIKPTEGSRGQGVVKCGSLSEALAITSNQQVVSWSASPFIDIEREVRLVVLDGIVKLAYEKFDPPVINRLKMFNLNLGAKARYLDLATIEPSLQQLVQQAMQAIGLRLGAVDVVFTAGGSAQILEINSGFSLEHFAGLSSENRQSVVSFYEQLIEHILTQ